MADFLEIDRSELDEESDRYGTYPHPREMLIYGGPSTQERLLLDAYRSGRMHHGWLFAGPEGVGKAVLAYRFARFLLANPDPQAPAVAGAQDLSVPADHPVAGQVARLSHPDLSVIRRSRTKDGKSVRAETAVDDVRDGLSVFRTTSGSGGWRIVIVDTADDLNRSSANALLKMLEEPPERALFILIAQSLGSLLPTIRSRCRIFRFAPLATDAVARIAGKLGDFADDDLDAAAARSAGSVRAALAHLDADAAAFRSATLKVLDSGQGSGKAAQALADGLAGRAKAPAFQSFIDIVEERLRDAVHAAGNGRAASGWELAARAELWEKLRRSARDVETYNLDRRPFILAILSELAEIERRPR